MSEQLILLAGSPRTDSRSTHIARQVAGKLEAANVRLRTFGVADFVSCDVLFARTDSRGAQQLHEQIQASSALIFSTPVYKAAYSGGLKLLIDLIPHDALRGKIVLAVASARAGRHFPSVQRAFDDLYRFFDVGLVVPSIFVLDEQIWNDEAGFTCDANAQADIDRAADTLLSTLATPQTV